MEHGFEGSNNDHRLSCAQPGKDFHSLCRQISLRRHDIERNKIPWGKQQQFFTTEEKAEITVNMRRILNGGSNDYNCLFWIVIKNGEDECFGRTLETMDGYTLVPTRNPVNQVLQVCIGI